MTEGLLAIIGSILTLAIGILNEFFSASARARAEGEAFDKAQLQFSVLAQKALEKWNKNAADAAAAAQSGQDWLDQNRKPKP